MSRAKLVFRNSIANVVRAAATSAVGIFLPILLLSVLNRSSYSAWALVFSLASYVMFLDIGMPASVQALVARANASDNTGAARGTVVSGIKVSISIVAAFLVIACLIALSLGIISPDIDPDTRNDAAWALLILTLGQSANLLSNTTAAYFTGLQRSLVATVVIAPTRLICFIVCGSVAYFSQNLVLAAIGFAVPSVIASAILISIILWETRGTRLARGDKEHSVRGLLRYSGPLILWSIIMLMSTGLGVTIVAHFAYEDLVPFTLAQLVYMGIYGLVFAVGGPLLPELVRSSVRTPDLLPQKIILATRIHSAILYIIAGAATISIPFLFHFTAGHVVEHATAWATAIILVWAATIHMAAAPLNAAFIATNRHHRLIFAPTMQGVSTVILSLAFAPLFGGLGVAIGTVSGSYIGLVLACYLNVPRSGIAALKGHTAAVWALWAPSIGLFLCTVLVAVASAAIATNFLLSVLISLIGLCSVIMWEWWIVVPSSTRSALKNTLENRLSSLR